MNAFFQCRACVFNVLTPSFTLGCVCVSVSLCVCVLYVLLQAQEYRRSFNLSAILVYLLAQHRKHFLFAGIDRWHSSMIQQRHFKVVCKKIIICWLSRCLAISFASWRRSSLESVRLRRWGLYVFISCVHVRAESFFSSFVSL
jgi:hypothetical protein